MVADQHYRWLVVLFSVLMQAVCVGTLVYCFTLFALPWLDEFEASRRDVMLTISMLQIGMGLCSPLIGRLLDTFPIRYAVLAGVACMVLGLWLAQHATALWQVWVLYATVFPLATALMGTLAAQTLVAKWFRDQQGLALGLSAMGTNLGGMVLPYLVAGWLAEAGWRETFGYLSMLSLLLVGPLAWIVLGRNPPAGQAPQMTDDGTPTAAHLRVWQTRDILRTSLFWRPALCLVPLNLTFGALQFNLGGFARDAGLGDGVTATFVMTGSFSMILGKVFFGSLGDRVDHRFLFWLACSVMLLALIGFVLAASFPELMLAVIAMGLAGGGILPLMGLIFGARFGAASFGRVMGFVMLSVLVSALGPVIMGWIRDLQGAYTPALYLMMLLIVPAVVAMRWLPPAPAASS